MYSNIALPYTPQLPRGLFIVGLPVKMLKAQLPSFILTICPAHLNLLDLVTLIMLNDQ